MRVKVINKVMDFRTELIFMIDSIQSMCIHVKTDSEKYLLKNMEDNLFLIYLKNTNIT